MQINTFNPIQFSEQFFDFFHSERGLKTYISLYENNKDSNDNINVNTPEYYSAAFLLLISLVVSLLLPIKLFTFSFAILVLIVISLTVPNLPNLKTFLPTDEFKSAIILYSQHKPVSNFLTKNEPILYGALNEMYYSKVVFLNQNGTTEFIELMNNWRNYGFTQAVQQQFLIFLYSHSLNNSFSSFLKRHSGKLVHVQKWIAEFENISTLKKMENEQIQKLLAHKYPLAKV